MKIEESIIDLDIIEEYERDTGKEWTEIEEHMAEICSHYDYGFNWNKDGNIVINNEYYEGTWEDIDVDYYTFFGKSFTLTIDGIVLKHYEYKNAEEMVNAWMKKLIKDKDRLKGSYVDGRFDWL